MADRKLRMVDLFAGWGGFTEGAEQAGHRVVWAANHWDLAVTAHALNHPKTTHVLQDLNNADWRMLPQYDVLLASPACQGHSTASQPKRREFHEVMRATAFAVVECCETTRPEAFIVENVEFFRRWPLYPLWKQSLVELGYDVTENLVTATDHGVPQRRVRLFVVGTLRAGHYEYQPPGRKKEPSFGPCVQWAKGRWRSFGEVSSGKRKRIEAGLKRHGKRFIGQDVTGHRGIPLSEPIRTITTKDQWWVVKGGNRVRNLTVREVARAMGFPDSYTWPEGTTRTNQMVGLGNAVCPPVAKDLIRDVAKLVTAAKRSRKGRPRRAVPPPSSPTAGLEQPLPELPNLFELVARRKIKALPGGRPLNPGDLRPLGDGHTGYPWPGGRPVADDTAW